MNKIQNLVISLIEYDKALHFIAGFCVFVISSCFISDLYSVAVVFIVALAKEIRDQIVYRGWDSKDLGATVLGGLTVSLTLKFI